MEEGDRSNREMVDVVVIWLRCEGIWKFSAGGYLFSLREGMVSVSVQNVDLELWLIMALVSITDVMFWILLAT